MKNTLQYYIIMKQRKINDKIALKTYTHQVKAIFMMRMIGANEKKKTRRKWMTKGNMLLANYPPNLNFHQEIRWESRVKTPHSQCYREKS